MQVAIEPVVVLWPTPGITEPISGDVAWEIVHRAPRVQGVEPVNGHDQSLGNVRAPGVHQDADSRGLQRRNTAAEHDRPPDAIPGVSAAHTSREGGGQGRGRTADLPLFRGSVVPETTNSNTHASPAHRR